MRFLLRWQHCAPDTRLSGKQGLRAVVERLQGFEAPAVAWERDLLPTRLTDYDPAWLDELCLDGTLTWGRLSPRKSSRDAGLPASPSRVMPVSLGLRADFPLLRAATAASPADTTGDDTAAAPGEPVAGASRVVLDLLRDRGALFFDEIVNGSRRLATEVEAALRDLVARGLVHADGYEGLRHLAGKRRAGAGRRRGHSRYPGGRFAGSGPAGRWAVVRDAPADLDAEDLAQGTAEILLARYGVIFRDLLARESVTVPWRHILRALRRLEARGQVRGGRFVAGFVGEQYALPEAVEALRAVRRRDHSGERVYLSAVDPCNLVGIVLPGDRITARAGDALTLIDGALPDDAETVGRIAWPHRPEQVVVTPRADLDPAAFASDAAPAGKAARRAVNRVTGRS